LFWQNEPNYLVEQIWQNEPNPTVRTIIHIVLGMITEGSES